MPQPNLDNMTFPQLTDFVQRERFEGQGLRLRATRMFPDRPNGYLRAYEAICQYAWNRIAALTSLRMGRRKQAQMYNDICDRIYRELPAYARWERIAA